MFLVKAKQEKKSNFILKSTYSENDFISQENMGFLNIRKVSTPNIHV